MRHLLLCSALLLPLAACAGWSRNERGEAAMSSSMKRTPPVGDWLLVSHDGGGSEPSTEITMSVQEDGKIVGSGGCNRYFATWSLTDPGNTVGGIGSTRKMCEASVMDREAEFLELLSNVAGWVDTEAGIQLTDVAGRPVLTFQPQ